MPFRIPLNLYQLSTTLLKCQIYLNTPQAKISKEKLKNGVRQIYYLELSVKFRK